MFFLSKVVVRWNGPESSGSIVLDTKPIDELIAFLKESKTQFCLSDYTSEIIRATYRNLHKAVPPKLCASIVGNVLDENDCPFQIAITAVFPRLITTGDVLRLNHRSKGIHQ